MTTIRVEVEPPVTIITLNRPAVRNALNPEMVADLTQAFLTAEADTRCRLVILQAEGPVFCAGMDLAALDQSAVQPYETNLDDARQLGALLNHIWSLSKPVVALVRGPALGGGCGLAAVCDITLATSDATFGFPEVRIGIVPALVSVFLVRAIGEKPARELLLTGRILTAQDAHRAGLVQDVVQESGIDGRARELATLIVATSPAAVAATKRLIATIPTDELERAAVINAAARSTPDCREGVRAFLEKRRPNWNRTDKG